MRALFLSALTITAAQAETALRISDPLDRVQGDWGLEIFDDMNCANNPVRIVHQEARLIFQWPKSVEYADGSVSAAVSFAVVAVDGDRLSLRRERDGIAATIVVAQNGRSFQYFEGDPEAGSDFDRCTSLSS